jgi:hypothetical protein
MKRLVCLCALLFAGHAMAQTTCSNATLNGYYLAKADPGDVALPVTSIGALRAVASATFNGLGGVALTFNYTIGTGLVNGVQTENATITVNPNCSFSASANFLGVPVTVTGFTSPSGSAAVFVTQTTGIAVSGKFEKQ